MYYKNEKALQKALAKRLRSQGLDVKLEVVNPGGRVDILTPLHLIECKHYLTRQSINEAAGQLGPYSAHFPNRRKVIAGLTPKDKDSSYAAAKRQEQAGIETWYLDRSRVIPDGFGIPGWLKNLIVGGLTLAAGSYLLSGNWPQIPEFNLWTIQESATELSATLVDEAIESLIRSSDACDRAIGSALSEGLDRALDAIEDEGCRKRAESILKRLGNSQQGRWDP